MMDRCQICFNALIFEDNDARGWLIEDDKRRWRICRRCKDANEKIWKCKVIESGEQIQ